MLPRKQSFHLIPYSNSEHKLTVAHNAVELDKRYRMVQKYFRHRVKRNRITYIYILNPMLVTLKKDTCGSSRVRCEWLRHSTRQQQKYIA